MGCQGRFRKGVGGKGLAANKPPKRAKKVLQKCVLLLLRGHRRKGTEKRPESLASEGFLAPTPSVRQPLFETSEKRTSGTEKQPKHKVFGAGYSWDIRDPDVGISRTKTLCKWPFSVVLERDVTDLGRDVPDLEKLYARKLWAGFSYPRTSSDPRPCELRSLFGGSQKGGFQKGGFGRSSPVPKSPLKCLP